MRNLRFILTLLIAVLGSSAAAQEGKHLFILSGQSNMQRMVTTVSFTPALQEAFGRENIVVVKDALGGQPIRRWYKGWKQPDGKQVTKIGDLYDQLMERVLAQGDPKNYSSVTFIWMQGENDARRGLGDYYKNAFLGLLDQLKTDLGRDDIFVVIGRISDHDLGNEKFKHWTMIREIQVELAEEIPNARWVNTDDLNDGVNQDGESIHDDLHYSVEGYKTFGERLAGAAIEQIKTTPESI
ncbi:acetyl xylan esterase [Ruficoccus amylovorans]|jgi:lysophospholipase L1-like esterase|uniref:Acetyl xylan esterase n=1 Tax=Ruficoccus amylovorans TaxID=1804625 RepID=A0A842HD84_9BACT|nr:sialate O-acetylesterase [Ruficoccus amylovorans]MBC2594485.1 acetyl xylan esterase [Ruficoccus amylovorans]